VEVWSEGEVVKLIVASLRIRRGWLGRRYCGGAAAIWGNKADSQHDNTLHGCAKCHESLSSVKGKSLIQRKRVLAFFEQLL
jgi:hypothetical protein